MAIFGSKRAEQKDRSDQMRQATEASYTQNKDVCEGWRDQSLEGVWRRCSRKAGRGQSEKERATKDAGSAGKQESWIGDWVWLHHDTTTGRDGELEGTMHLALYFNKQETLKSYFSGSLQDSAINEVR